MARVRTRRTGKRSINKKHMCTPHVGESEDILSGATILKHRLKGPGISYRETPNKGGTITPHYLVFHYTAGRSATSSVNWLTNPAANASAHIVVGRDGSMTQLAPFNVKTWHAGRSHWDGLDGMNQHAIGIELDNAGPLKKEGKKLTAWFGKAYPVSQVIHATHKLDIEPRWWHAYSEQQIAVAVDLAKLLVKQYGLKEIIGHDDIAPDRKRDPGPAFPLDHIQAAVLGRSEEVEAYTVRATSLNIRSGPGTEFPKVSRALRKGAKLILLEKDTRWSRVEVQGKQDVEGWVFNKFIQKV